MGSGTMGRRRRYWSKDEKRRICREASAPGVSVARVARRYSLNANLLFKWLRDPRFAPGLEAEEPIFLPVEVSRGRPVDMAMEPAAISSPGGRVLIELSGGHRIVAEGDFDGDALGRLLRVWLS